MDKYTSLLCWSQRVTWIFGSALDTAHQNSILQNTKILIKILHITEMLNPIIACCCTLWNRTTTT